ncbi:hypothetical protein H8N00_00085 [Streptomyces sp. AC563]|uniref:DUF6082 family protein n=1 Tax=Streptomyces buecherae TaxID=2763006 RepID=UPI00164CF2F4|nr:DUF6082 family protein [Streptomyces buecherae]MBC3987336.1 hypothetical protein [Streptomyces buecherae]
MARRTARGLAWVAATAAVLAVLLLSPFVLEGVSDARDVDWNRLSQVGAAYGFTSAVVSALALAGVAASLIAQNRQARAEQIHGIRGYYLELARMELDDMALYQPVWGDTDIAEVHQRKRHVYADLMMNYAWMGYEVGTIPEPLLRDMLAGMFTGEAGRHYWERAHASWAASASGSRVGRRFLVIVAEEHVRAVASGPPVRSAAPPDPPDPPDVPPAGTPSAWQAAIGTLVGLGTGLALGSIVRSRSGNGNRSRR